MRFNVLLLLLQLVLVTAIDLNPSDPESIRTAAGTIAGHILDYYNTSDPDRPVGLFIPPYFWWQSGAAWGSLLDYWYYTGDTQYNHYIKESLLAQVGENKDYVPLNQTTTEGNDDQAFWGITVMAAAERGFENPNSSEPQWLYLAQAVFNTMSLRWDGSDACEGGLRWQIFQWNSGYDYKNAVSNGAFYHLAARLARYTGNSTYVEWATKIWDWMEKESIIDGNTNYLLVFDGVHLDGQAGNCSRVSSLQWSYNAGLLLSGAAYLFDHTQDPMWEDRMYRLLTGLSAFFKDNVMFEAACQPAGVCNNDQRSFKAYLSRFLGLTAQLHPGTRETINAYLRHSAINAAASCTGGYDGVTCGLNWHLGYYDNKYGLGEQMSALEVIQNLLYNFVAKPLTAVDGGNSTGDGNAGMDKLRSKTQKSLVIRSKDKAGASFVTVFAGLSMIGLSLWTVL